MGLRRPSTVLLIAGSGVGELLSLTNLGTASPALAETVTTDAVAVGGASS